MAIVKLEDKFKSDFHISLSPERHFVSSSSGITGSVYVFPNRSESQKDNIDERLNLAPMVEEGTEFSGTPIRPYDCNSLEQRRIEIYEADFGKMIGGLFADALQYEYILKDVLTITISNGGTGYNANQNYTAVAQTATNGAGSGATFDVTTNSSGVITAVAVNNAGDGKYNIGDTITLDASVIGGGSNLSLSVGSMGFPDVTAGTVAADGINAIDFAVNNQVKRTSDGAIFTWTSNFNWSNYDAVISYNQVPTSDRDKSSANYEPALGMLLDGANPFTGDTPSNTDDHAWRGHKYYDSNADSYVTWGQIDSLGNQTFQGSSSGTNGATKQYFQLSGRTTEEDAAGIPQFDSIVTQKAQVNAWPPEIEKWSASVITNYMLSGYSDLSMHPRNSTKKNVVLNKANHDIFSSGSIQQKMVARKLKDSPMVNNGWWYHNYQALCLSKWKEGTNTYHPALLYKNNDSVYDLDKTHDFMLEFYIKPTVEQKDTGCIVHVPGNYAVTITPDESKTINGVPQEFKIYFHWGSSSNQAGTGNSSPKTKYEYRTSTNLSVNTWHHVICRYSPAFNNGEFVFFIDGVSDKNIYIDSSGTSYPAGTIETKTWSNGNQITRFNDGLVFTRQGSNTRWDDPNNAQFHKIPPVGVDGGESVRTTGFIWNNTTSPEELMVVGGWWGNSGSSQTNIFGVYAANQGIGNSSSGTIALGLDYSKNTTLKYHLNSEIHELRCWNTTKSQLDISIAKQQSLSSTSEVRYYLPFVFDPRSDTPVWKRLGFLPETQAKTKEDYYQKGTLSSLTRTSLTASGVGIEKAPFCTNSAYIAGMPVVNIHAHLREYKNGRYPVILGYPDRTSLASYPATPNGTTDSKIEYFINNWQQNAWLKNSNSMLLPCDNLNFKPSYDLINSDGHLYNSEKGWIKLEGAGIGSTDSNLQMKHFFDDEQFSIQDTVQSIDPEFKNSKLSQSLNINTAYLVDNNLLDPEDYISPLSTVISIPSIFYGNSIKPESIILKFYINYIDSDEKGKEITLVDYDGKLYRKDITNSEFPENKVGQVDYASGVIIIYSPLLVNLGIDNFDIKFKGSKNMHVMQIDIPCPQGVANISSASSYKESLLPTSNSNESGLGFTYISTINLHDENLNVIGKVNLAQPIVKREEDSFVFRVKVDF